MIRVNGRVSIEFLDSELRKFQSNGHLEELDRLLLQEARTMSCFYTDKTAVCIYGKRLSVKYQPTYVAETYTFQLDGSDRLSINKIEEQTGAITKCQPSRRQEGEEAQAKIATDSAISPPFCSPEVSLPSSSSAHEHLHAHPEHLFGKAHVNN